MTPLDLNKSIENVISAITTCEQSAKADVLDVTRKVEAFVKSNEKAITPSQREEIKTLLGRLNDATTKAASCTALKSIINTAAKNLQLPDTKLQTAAAAIVQPDVKHLKEAEQVLNSAINYSHDGSTTKMDDCTKRFVEMTTEAERVFIIKRVIRKDEKSSDSPAVLEYLTAEFKKLKMTKEQDRTDILKMIASIDGYFGAKGIGNFQITKKESRAEIAQLIAKRFAVFQESFAEYLANFEIDSEDDRFEIAKIHASNTNNWQTRTTNKVSQEREWKTLEFYNIHNQKYLIELAKIEVAAAPKKDLLAGIISERISKYQIADEKARFEIALQIATKDWGDNWFPLKDLAENIKNYQLNETHRTQIAEILAKTKEPKSLCENIDNFQLSEDNRIAIAKILAANRNISQHLLDNLPKFTTKPERLDILLVMANRNTSCWGKIIDYTDKLQLTEQERFEIAKKLAGKQSLFFNKFKKYNLNYSHRLAIALEGCDRSYFYDIANYIKGFDLNEKDRFEIAKRIARRSPQIISKNIEQFDLKDENQRIAIANLAASNDGPITIPKLKKFNLTKPAEILFTALRFCFRDLTSLVIVHFEDIYFSQPLIYPPAFDDLKKYVDASQDENAKHWLKAFYSVIQTLNEKDYQECASLAAQFLGFENSDIRYRLADALYQYGIPPVEVKGPPHLKVLNVLLAPLLKNSELADQDIKTIWEVLGSQEYRDNRAKQETIIKGLHSLLMCRDLSQKEKGVLLKHVFENNKKTPVFISCQKLDAIISSTNTVMLKTAAEQPMKEADVKDSAEAVKELNLVLKQPIDLESTFQQVFKPHMEMLLKLIDLSEVRPGQLAITAEDLRELVANFELFAIADENTRFKIAKLIANHDPHVICENIEHFQLSADNRLALAKALAVHVNIYTHLLNNIKKFVTGKCPMDLVKLIASNRYGNSYLSEFITKLGLTEQERFEAAMISSSNLNSDICANEVMTNNQAFQLSYEHRLAFAHALCSRYPQEMTRTINAFDFKEEDRFEIAKNIVRRSPEAIHGFIKTFGLNENHRVAIARIAAAEDGLSTISHLSQYETTNPTSILFTALRFCLPEDIERIKDRFQENNKKILETYPTDFAALDKLITDSKNESAKVWYKTFGAAIQALNKKGLKDWKECASIAQAIADQNTESRYLLTAALAQYGIPAPDKKNDPHAKLLNLLLAPWLKDSQLTEKEIKAIFDILGTQTYRESPSKREAVFKGLSALLECLEFSPQEKGALLKHIVENNKKTPAYQSLQMLEAIISSENTKMLKITPAQSTKEEASEKDSKAAASKSIALKFPLDLDATLQRIFKDSIGLDPASLTDFGQKYSSTIAKARNPMALLIYAANLGNLPQAECEAALKALKNFTESVLNKTYKTMRYQAPAGSHLATVFENREHLQKEWQQGASLTIGELFQKMQMKESDTKSARQDEINVVEYLSPRVFNFKHLDPELYKRFAACLKDPKKCKTMNLECQKALGEALKKLSKDQNMKKIKAAEPTAETLPILQLHLEANLISFLAASETKKINQLLPDVKKLCGQQFAEDLEGLQKQMEAADKRREALRNDPNAPKMETNYDNYIIADTDEWEDMELSGTEVTGSCQRIGGVVHYNKCLLAYMLDGKNRAIVIKDPKTGKIDPKTGQIDPKTCKIVARRIMRLLWDAENSQPVIFQEHLYDNNVPPRAKQAIDIMFALRAKEMNLPLVRSATAESTASSSTSYPNNLRSLSSPAPFEYVDAAGIRITNGDFTIQSKDTLLVPT